MKVIFYSNRMQFNGDWLTKRGLGGSESALINVSSAWKELYPEDEVIVYNGVFPRKETNFNGVEYKTFNDFMLEHKTFNSDIFISLREEFPFSLPFLNSKLKCLWSQDDTNEIGIKTIFGNSYLQQNIDIMFVISDHSYNDIKRILPNMNLQIIRNGYKNDWLENHEFRKPVAVYTSTPFRGLEYLVELWPEIYKKCYNIFPKLKIFGDMSLYGRSDNDFKPLYESLKNLPNVEFIGAICQRDLYKELHKSKVMLYPNNFLETGCMAVLEALACGNWVITTNLGALGEQVKHGRNGFLINGNPSENKYKEEFINYGVQALSNTFLLDNEGLIFNWKEQTTKMRNVILEKL